MWAYIIGTGNELVGPICAYGKLYMADQNSVEESCLIERIKTMHAIM